MFVHAWDPNQQNWHHQPIAFTQGIVTPRRFAGGSLFLLKADLGHEDWKPSGVSLRRGRYLIKVFLDSNQVLASDPIAFLSSDDFRGAIETRGVWGEGFKDAKIVSAAELRTGEPARETVPRFSS